MTLEKHKELVQRSVILASEALILVLVVQLAFDLDFQGLPFLFFALVTGVLGLSLPIALLLKRFSR